MKCCSIKNFQGHLKLWRMSFLNVKILPELFHLDIELLQMIFQLHQCYKQYWLHWFLQSYSWNIRFFRFCQSVSLVLKTVPADNSSEFRTITTILQAVPVALISTVLFTEHSTLSEFSNRFSHSEKRLYKQIILRNLEHDGNWDLLIAKVSCDWGWRLVLRKVSF